MRYNAFIYCRCAAYQQGQGVPDSIQQQDKLCRLFADAEKDNVLETITDLGSSVARRTALGLITFSCCFGNFPNRLPLSLAIRVDWHEI
jgi:hypothetical protein